MLTVIEFKLKASIMKKSIMTRTLQGKTPAHDNHRLLLCHDNGSVRYDNHTIDIIAHH